LKQQQSYGLKRAVAGYPFLDISEQLHPKSATSCGGRSRVRNWSAFVTSFLMRDSKRGWKLIGGACGAGKAGAEAVAWRR
jgi:hypothetical protein